MKPEVRALHHLIGASHMEIAGTRIMTPSERDLMEELEREAPRLQRLAEHRRLHGFSR